MEPIIAIIIVTERGGTIQNQTLKNLKQKIIFFQITAIILLILINTMVLEGFAKVFSRPLALSFLNPIFISFIFTLIGIILGLMFYALSFLRKKTKKIIVFGGLVFLIFLLFSTYFVLGGRAYIELVIFLLKIIFILILCSIVITGLYGILKHKKNIILGVVGALLIFFFFSEILFYNLQLLTDKIEYLILIFILILCFIEISLITIFFNNAFKKFSLSDEEYGGNLLIKFSSLINGYLKYLSIVLIICYFFALLIYHYTINLPEDFIEKFFGLDVSSNLGIWLFTIIVVVLFFALWALMSSENKNETNPRH